MCTLGTHVQRCSFNVGSMRDLRERSIPSYCRDTCTSSSMLEHAIDLIPLYLR